MLGTIPKLQEMPDCSTIFSINVFGLTGIPRFVRHPCQFKTIMFNSDLYNLRHIVRKPIAKSENGLAGKTLSFKWYVITHGLEVEEV